MPVKPEELAVMLVWYEHHVKTHTMAVTLTAGQYRVTIAPR